MTNDGMDVRGVADAIYTMVERALDVPVGLEIVTVRPEEMPAAMVQMLPGDPVVKRYRCGDWIGSQRWALYLRVAVRDTAGRIDAVAALSGAADILEAAAPDMPTGYWFQRTETLTSPAMRDATDDYETWQVTFATQFKRTRERQ